MTNKLQLGLVGLGRVSKSHIPAAKALSDRIELTAFVTRDEQKLQEEAIRWNVPKNIYVIR